MYIQFKYIFNWLKLKINRYIDVIDINPHALNLALLKGHKMTFEK
jgi:hypothetical protein